MTTPRYSLPAGAAALGAACVLVLAACNRDAPSCPPCDCPAAPEATPGAEPATPAAPAEPVDEVLPGLEALSPDTFQAQQALETAKALFSGRYAAVRARFVPALRADVSEERLEEIVEGVQQAHGPPARVMDAWLTSIKEENVEKKAAAVLLRMSKSTTRFRLLLVFDASGMVEGFWLRPI